MAQTPTMRFDTPILQLARATHLYGTASLLRTLQLTTQPQRLSNSNGLKHSKTPFPQQMTAVLPPIEDFG
eukprot:CAMPEP_0184296954 /NCGR_PEP_ID=MMETSP1049-20130417/7895_1 /TAXON_ID=77928 /ORGANISM="Proteomonas sulcata, Strain CCMP704" /LENGTH=69 /DNA_ID=CAMNT_0026606443 /DNA_START=67 /DNA_END=272 /DNA_ORIENTATION=+